MHLFSLFYFAYKSSFYFRMDRPIPFPLPIAVCLAHGLVFSNHVPCQICTYLSIENLNKRSRIRNGEQSAPLIDLETDSFKGIYSPLILEGAVDVWDHLRLYPEDRPRLHLPDDYVNSWTEPFCNLRVLNLRIPGPRDALMPPPRVETPPLSPPESPTL